MRRKMAEALLEIKAVSLRPDNPYTWASGIRSPIYCDNRLTLSYPELRREIARGLADIIREEFPAVEMIMGTATAGIPHAVLVAEELDLPMGYVRASAKDHGKENSIEGVIREGAKVVVVEDLISTGGSSLAVVKTLQEAGFIVLGVVAIFTYKLEQARENFQREDIQLHTLTDYETLIEVALARDYIREGDLAKLKKWRENPADSRWMEL